MSGTLNRLEFGMSKRLRTLLLAVVWLVSSVPAAHAQAASALKSVPPIIDREEFFGDPEISGTQISPDGRFISFLKPFNGTRNIWVKRTEEAFDKARPITADTKRPITQYFWSRDAKFVLFAQDAGGDENFNVYAVNPGDAPAAGAEVPAARNLTDVKGVRAAIYSVPRSDPDAIYVGLNDRDKAWHDLYKVRISTGERTLLRRNTDRISSWTFDLSGKLRLASRSAENGDTEILRVDDNGFSKIYTCDVFEQCGSVRFHKDGRRVFFQTNKGVNLVRLTLLDAQTGHEELVEADPESRVDLDDAIFSEASDDLIATIYIDDRERVVWKDRMFEADDRLLRQKLAGKEIGYQSSTRDERLNIVVARADVDPGSVYLFDRQTRQLTLQYRSREKLKREWLAPMIAIRYPSSDGLEIPAYLTLPKGASAKDLPLLVLPHGGPWARDVWGYNTWAQFFANRGYAVLMPNFRGSTGYGKKFLDAGNKQWGDRMQDDLTWGVKYLISQGTIDPKRVGIFGGSYGGYATLAGVAFTPDIYAAAVSFVGPSNLLTLLNSIPPYWEAGRKMFMERMGDPSTAEGKAQLERQSPLNSAAKIRTPLLVIQGANDPRVNKAESEQIVVALRDRGFPVEYLLAPDEGHGFKRPINNMAAYAAMEKFLGAHLGGRYQENMTPEVRAQLKVLTVDPKTLERPKTITTSSASPKPASSLETGNAAYQMRVEMGGQKMDMAATTEIKDEGTSWVVIETAKGPMGEMTDRTTLDKTSLVVRKRSITQGTAMSVDLEMKDGKAIGEMKMNGQAKPISVDLAGGDLFADGAGSGDVIATLPLADGYSTTFRNLDPQTLQAKAMELKVIGSEQVTVPAGTFDAFKVEVSAADGAKSTMWIAKSPRKPVKATATSPAMNGAIVTVELRK
jgi:dipeptidyl aminopeptidase/acylaminoacyl peptidase